MPRLVLFDYHRKLFSYPHNYITKIRQYNKKKAYSLWHQLRYLIHTGSDPSVKKTYFDHAKKKEVGLPNL
jgi:hypothetical protein